MKINKFWLIVQNLIFGISSLILIKISLSIFNIEWDYMLGIVAFILLVLARIFTGKKQIAQEIIDESVKVCERDLARSLGIRMAAVSAGFWNFVVQTAFIYVLLKQSVNYYVPFWLVVVYLALYLFSVLILVYGTVLYFDEMRVKFSKLLWYFMVSLISYVAIFQITDLVINNLK